MYTQCPECSTVFRVTADALRAAQGRVRCGICSASFSALDYLSEQPLVRLAAEDAFDDTITVEELPGTEFIELSGAGEPPATEAAPLAAVEDTGGSAAEAVDDIPDAALEFHGSPEDLERLFVTAEPPGTAAASSSWEITAADAAGTHLGQAPDEAVAVDFSGIEVEETGTPWLDAGDEYFEPEAEAPVAGGEAIEAAGQAHVAEVLAFRASPPASAPEAAGEVEHAPASGDLDRTDEYPVLVLDEPGEPAGDASPAAPAGEPDAAAGSTEVPAADDAPPVLLIPEELRRGTPPPDHTGFEDLAAGRAAPAQRRWSYAVAALVLALALAAQAVNHWRDSLARNPAVGPWLLAAYSALGLPMAAPLDLSAFELRQLGTASDPGHAGRLKLRASIVNRAPFAQPYPLLRLTLQDRFGSTLGSRDLEPGEYLPGGPRAASGLLGPAQRADAEVVFVDPGRDAVGFELDVCARTASGVRCSGDRATPQS